MVLNFFDDLIHLFYPRVCYACGKDLKKNEEVICLFCRYFLPQTYFHLHPQNPVEKYFWGRIPVESASACYYFNKGSKVQRLIHHLKYQNGKEVGIMIGKIYGEELRKSRFNSIDMIIPVPLHSRKIKKRGYNQSDYFAEGLSEGMKRKWDQNIIIRRSDNLSQTRKSRIERWKNANLSFRLIKPEKINNKHILLIDDVVTTGATLEACAIELLKAEGVKISIATIAVAN